MCYVYVCEQGATICVLENQFLVKCGEVILASIPAETLEVLEIFGQVHLTTACVHECLKRGISVGYYNTYGTYYGRLVPTHHANVNRQRLQAKLSQNEEFRLEFSRKIIEAKIHNQIVILRRYARTEKQDISSACKEMGHLQKKVLTAASVEQLMGYEGNAARIYFRVIGELIHPDFSFEGRTKRPPLDPFNSLISFGYSILMNEIYGKLEGRGMNPFWGYLHKDQEHHAALASDLMEEWRAVLVDSTALSMLNGKELYADDFYMEDGGVVYLSHASSKKYIQKLERKFTMKQQYYKKLVLPTSFRHAIDYQILQLIKAMETGDLKYYEPLRIR